MPAVSAVALQRWARSLKRDTYALYLAGRDPRVPWLAKLIIAATVAYAMSPIDLIPDFIPVLGYLDDLLLVPLGIWLAVRLVPPAVWQECREKAAARPQALGRSRAAAAVVVSIWLLAALALAAWLYRLI